MKFLTSKMILAVAFGLASVSSFANDQSEISPEVLKQLPPVQTVADVGTPTTTTDETAPPATPAVEEKTDEATSEQPEASPVEKPE